TADISPAIRGENGRKAFASFPVNVEAGWNFVSLPLGVAGARKDSLFPTSVSPAYTYEDSYIAKETLDVGVGYWMKFAAPQTIFIQGDTVFDGAVQLRTGWNMIGSFSVPMPVSHIYTEPGGIISSKYFRYVAAGGYQQSDTLQPGLGYWVKTTQEGMLYLTAPGGAEGPIGDSVRSVILDSINAFVNRLPHVDDAVDNLTLLSYLRSMPEFEASDTALGAVWARFIDGRMFIRSNDWHVSDSASEYAAGILSKTHEIENVTSPTDNLPSSSTAWICNALGSFFDNPQIMPGGGVTETVNQLRQWHTLTGYTVPSYASASVGNLKRVSGVGVFYISAHGGPCYDRDSNYVFSVWSSTVQDWLLDLIYKWDLDDGNLVYFTAPDIDDGTGHSIERTHYAITEKFVKKYMNFQQGAALFFNACYSRHPAHK
ncbi:MAG TPA: hypothetical protein VJ508_16445, partial [Saprospiraceae bacterium]|nr:hypothetical protein [Saprospiraceae bacterium]